MAKGKVRMLRLEQLKPPESWIRSERGRLDELAASVAELGVLVPLLVRALGAGVDGLYEVLAGAGRLEALWLTGGGPKLLVPCVVVDVDDSEALLLALVENVVREDMRPFDEAEAARMLVEDYGLTQGRVAKALGMTQPAVSAKLSVFRLDPQVVAALRKGSIDMRPARALLPLIEDRVAQRLILKRMLAEKLTAAQVSALVAKERLGKAALSPLSFAVAGAGKVQARTTARGKLRVTLEAEDEQALEKLWRSLRKQMSRG